MNNNEKKMIKTIAGFKMEHPRTLESTY